MSSFLSRIIPINLSEEKQKFLSNTSYNPQFIYKEEFPLDHLHFWGTPNQVVVNHCLEKIKTTDLTEHSNTTPSISEADITQAVQYFNTQYHLEHPLEVEFSPNFLVRCRVSSRVIYFRLPLFYSHEMFADLYRHELETHVLRRLNHQTNFQNTDHTNDENHRRIEEGLATLHTHLLRQNKMTIKTYLVYLSVYFAQQNSFADTFQHFLELGISTERAFDLTARAKRGLTDTARPGGLTKDICYLEGTVQVWDWINNQKKSPRDLYLGRLNLAEAEQYAMSIDPSHTRYPSFFDNMELYLHSIFEIGEVNQFSAIREVIV